MGECIHVARAGRLKLLFNGAFAKFCRTGFAASAFALAVATPANAAGPLTIHMASHIVLMNVLAPLGTIILLVQLPALRRNLSRSVLAAATIAQVAALYAVHAPPAFVHSGTGMHALFLTSLFSIALLFWCAVFAQPVRDFWLALFALLVTGKLFCLLGALLVFAPRSLYLLPSGHAAHYGPISTLEDQQLAGLLMLLACPLSYVLAGIVVASKAIFALDAAVPLDPLNSIRR